MPDIISKKPYLEIPKPDKPLAERMRPQTLDEFRGQSHLLGENGVLSQLIKRDRIPSMILWGEPGTGKTTLVRIIANQTGGNLIQLSAVSSGVKDVRKAIEQAKIARGLKEHTIFFIDEIHRFNKAQQDALLHAVENGTLSLIGATTENPSFEVISPLLSRCRVFRYNMLELEDIEAIIDNALAKDEYLSKLNISFNSDSKGKLLKYSGGDARMALNTLEIATELSLDSATDNGVVITDDSLDKALQQRTARYDKGGEYHYDVISAFIKSMRGSDPDAAVYWLARMIHGGEDPKFIARRMLILASEDIGNANPTALVLASACADSVQFVGMPEAQIILAQTALYLSSSPKSNTAISSILVALADVKEDPERPVPLHLRNAVTGLMKAQDYGKGYQYAHNYPGGIADQVHLPNGLEDRLYYHPTEHGAEKAIKERLEAWWVKRRRDED